MPRSKHILTKKEVAVFWNKIDKHNNNDCWLWKGTKRLDYYGHTRINGIIYHAHRLVFILTHGSIPKGLCVLHTCDVPACCNPAHLFLGTRYDNNQDKMLKGRHVSSPGILNGRAKLNPIKVREIRAMCKGVYGSQVIAAAKYGVGTTVINDVVKGKRWTHVS